jgi:hypothetical protein
MPFAALDRLGPGSTVLFRPEPQGGGTLAVADAWLGRVLDPLGRSLDGHGPLADGPRARRVKAAPPEATRPGAELFRDVPAWPAARSVLWIRRRQVEPARHARQTHRV